MFPSEVGGFRIRDIGRFIAGLLAKWKWKTEVEEEGLWKEILESRYSSWRDMKLTMDDRKSSTWWRYICKICDVRNDHNWFKGMIKWKLGNG